MARLNTYTLVRGEVESGIELHQNGPFQEVRIGTEFDYYSVRFGDGQPANRFRTAPWVQGNKVIRGALVRYGKYPRMILPRELWDGAVVRVIARDLDFRWQPLAEGLRIWSGGENRTRPFVQYGRFREVDVKDQLFTLEHGESMLVVDRKTSIGVLTCRKGIVELRRAECGEVVAHLLRFAEETRSASALSWAIPTLATLGVKELRALEERRAALAA